MNFQFPISNFQFKSKKGFTLIEILVYIGVLAIIILAVYSFLTWTIKSNNKAKAMRETLDNTQRTMEIISYEIKEANSIYSPTTTSSQLSLETSHYLPADETTTYIDFYLCGTQLCLKKESQNPISLISDRVEVNTLEFNQIGNSVQINLEVNYKNPGNLSEYQASVNLTSTISLRSY